MNHFSPSEILGDQAMNILNPIQPQNPQMIGTAQIPDRINLPQPNPIFPSGDVSMAEERKDEPDQIMTDPLITKVEDYKIEKDALILKVKSYLSEKDTLLQIQNTPDMNELFEKILKKNKEGFKSIAQTINDLYQKELYENLLEVIDQKLTENRLTSHESRGSNGETKICIAVKCDGTYQK